MEKEAIETGQSLNKNFHAALDSVVLIPASRSNPITDLHLKPETREITDHYKHSSIESLPTCKQHRSYCHSGSAMPQRTEGTL